MMKILVPVDFSETSDNALMYAFHMLQKYKGELYILNTYEIPVGTSTVMIDFLDELKKVSEEGMGELKIKLANQSNYDESKVHFINREGSLVKELNKIVRTNKIDLVVMGTKGANGILEEMLGTNGVEVSRKSIVPTLLIPGNTNYKDFDSVALASDLSLPEGNELEVTLDKLNIKRAKDFKVLCVCNDELATSEQKEFEDRLRKYEYDLELLGGTSVEDELIRYLFDNDVNLLITIAKKHNFFENIFHKSVSKKLSLHSNYPLLVINEQ